MSFIPGFDFDEPMRLPCTLNLKFWYDNVVNLSKDSSLGMRLSFNVLPLLFSFSPSLFILILDINPDALSLQGSVSLFTWKPAESAAVAMTGRETMSDRRTGADGRWSLDPWAMTFILCPRKHSLLIQRALGQEFRCWKKRKDPITQLERCSYV